MKICYKKEHGEIVHDDNNCPCCTALDEKDDEINKKDDEINRLVEKINKLEKEITAYEMQRR